MNVEPYQFSELDNLGAYSLAAIIIVWTSSFQEEAGDFVLLLEQDKGKQQRMCPLALIGFLGECRQLPPANRLESRTSGSR